MISTAWKFIQEELFLAYSSMTYPISPNCRVDKIFEKLRTSIRSLPLIMVMLAILILPASAQGNVSPIPPEVAGRANDWT